MRTTEQIYNKYKHFLSAVSKGEALNAIRLIQEEAYNQALKDAAECLYDDELQYVDYHDFNAGVESVENSGKKEILKLKK